MVETLTKWLAEQGLGARSSILGFATSVSKIYYLLLPSHNMTETLWRKSNGNPRKIHRRGSEVIYSKLLPGDSKNDPFLSITASCPLLFYQKWSQPKLCSRFVSSCHCQRFRDLQQNSCQLGCLLRRPRESGHYKIRTWFTRASVCSVRQIYKYFCRDFFFLYWVSFLSYNYIILINDDSLLRKSQKICFMIYLLILFLQFLLYLFFIYLFI